MSIESELLAFLRKETRSSPLTKRNTEIVAFHYGMRSEPWPTLEQTAVIHAPLTRERVRKLIEWYFRKRVVSVSFPSATQIALFIERHAPISEHELFAKLREQNLVSGRCSAPGLRTLLHDLGLCLEYDLYKRDQRRVTRDIFAKGGDIFFAHTAEVARLAEIAPIIAVVTDPSADSSNDLVQILAAPETERMELLRSRIGQGRFRQSLIKLRGRCYVTGITDERFLRASHILSWSDAQATNETRLDPYNGLLLTPSYDHLFDQAYITFDDDGRLLISDNVPQDVRAAFNIDLKSAEDFRGDDLGAKTKNYLAHHRKRFHIRA